MGVNCKSKLNKVREKKIEYKLFEQWIYLKWISLNWKKKVQLTQATSRAIKSFPYIVVSSCGTRTSCNGYLSTANYSQCDVTINMHIYVIYDIGIFEDCCSFQKLTKCISFCILSKGSGKYAVFDQIVKFLFFWKCCCLLTHPSLKNENHSFRE